MRRMHALTGPLSLLLLLGHAACGPSANGKLSYKLTGLTKSADGAVAPDGSATAVSVADAASAATVGDFEIELLRVAPDRVRVIVHTAGGGKAQVALLKQGEQRDYFDLTGKAGVRVEITEVAAPE